MVSQIISPSPDNRIFNLSQYQILLGKYTYGLDVSNIIVYGDNHLLKIGSFCSIASNVKFMLGGSHVMNSYTTYPLLNGPLSLDLTDTQDLVGASIPITKGGNTEAVNPVPVIEIENDVWIGYGAFISSGVHVANGSVIAANSHIVKDVEPYEIVGGNPARRIRFRHEPYLIQELISLKWWDWPIEKIRENAKILQYSKISEIGLF